MSKRVFIGALGTETNQFVPFPTGLRSYQEHGIWRGDATKHERTNFTAPLHVWRKDAETRGWTASRRTDVDRAVRKAGRHSIAVRVVRVLLPVAMIGGVLSVVLVTYFKPMQMFEKLPSVSGKVGVQGSKITMELPRIAGFTRDSRSYELNAETAVQDITKPDQLELKNLRAEIEMADSDILVVTAKTGTYHTKADKVLLREHVVFTTAQGLNAKMSEAVVDMKKGNVVSEQPVEVKLPNGNLTANGLEIVDSGDVVRFTKGIVLHLDADQPATETKQEAKR